MSEEIYINTEPIPEIPEENPEQYKKGFAITALVLGILSVLCCCIGAGFILAPLALIFGIISLAKKQGGKGLAITGIVLSALSLIFSIYAAVQFSKFMPDLEYFVENDTAIIAAYEEDGTIPDRYDKYRDSKYDSLWEASGCKNFDEFFGEFVENYKKNSGKSFSSSSSKSDEKNSSSESEEQNKDA
jgi:hypothetical protein